MRKRVLLLLAGVGWLSLSIGVLADYKSDFRDGVRAMNQRDFPAAIRRFRRAIREQSRDSGELVNISGTADAEPYLPHALLGLALYQSTGRCEEALPEWQISRSQNAPVGLLKSQAGALAKAMNACAPPVPESAALKAALSRADKAIADAVDAQRKVADLSRNPALRQQFSSNGTLARDQARADMELSGARRTLDDARKTSDLKGVGRAQDAAARARELFEGVRTAATALLPQPPAVDNSKPEASGGNLLERIFRVGGDKGSASPAKPAPNAPPAVLTPDPRPAVPRSLQSAAGQFFKAQYSEAAKSLTAAKFDSLEDRLDAEWFQAASYYALYLVSGRKDEASLSRAQEHARACRRLDQTFLPDKRFFSPALIAFYQSVRDPRRRLMATTLETDLLLSDLEQPPLPHPRNRVHAAVFERQARVADDVADGAGDEGLAGRRAVGDARGEVEGRP